MSLFSRILSVVAGVGRVVDGAALIVKLAQLKPGPRLAELPPEPELETAPTDPPPPIAANKRR